MDMSGDEAGAVLLVANYESDVGYAWWLMEAFWATISAEASSAGRRCILAYPQVNAVPKVIRDAPINITTWRVRPSGLKSALDSARRMRRERVKSVYLTDWPVYSLSYFIWRLFGVQRIVLHDHSGAERPPITGPKAWLRSAIHAVELFSCDTYVAVSDYIGRRFVENSRIPSRRCLVVRNGIVPFSGEADRRLSIRSELSIPHDAVVVVLVSRASFTKGWDFAIRCAAELKGLSNRATSAHFVFVGDGPDLGAFRGLAKQGGVDDVCHFLGHRSDVLQILGAADLAFHPSKAEALSLATLEFMCAELPVIVPDRPSVCALTEDHVDGRIYESTSVVSASAIIDELIGDQQARCRMGRAARAKVLSDYTLEKTLDRFRLHVVPRLLG